MPHFCRVGYIKHLYFSMYFFSSMLFGECCTLLISSFRSFLRPPHATPFLFFPDNLLSSQSIFLAQVNTRISTYNTNFLKLSPSSESGTISAFYEQRKFHNSPQLATVLRQTNPFHSFDFCIFKIHFNVIRCTQGSTVGLLPSTFPTKTSTYFSCTPCLPHFPPITVSLFCYCNSIC